MGIDIAPSSCLIDIEDMVTSRAPGELPPVFEPAEAGATPEGLCATGEPAALEAVARAA